MCGQFLYEDKDFVVSLSRFMSILLALDLATKDTGYAIFNEDKLITSGVISEKSTYLEDRLIGMKYQIINLCNKYNVDVIISEQEQSQKTVNMKATTALCKMQGVLRCTADDLKISYLFVKINTWRIDVGIKHNIKREEQKKLALEKVKELFNLDIEKDDEAEALLIGRYFLNHKNEYTGL